MQNIIITRPNGKIVITFEKIVSNPNGVSIPLPQ